MPLDPDHQLYYAKAVLGHVRDGQYMLSYLPHLCLRQSMQPSQYAHFCWTDDWQKPHDGV